MWREILLEFAKDNPYIRINPPALNKEVAIAESKLSIVFPDELKECLLEVNGDGDALLSLELIIGCTNDIKMNCFISVRNLLLVARNGCGDYFGHKVVDGKVLDTNIYIWDHELDKPALVASDLKNVITRYYHDEFLI